VSHLRVHNISVDDYRKKYGKVYSETTMKRMLENLEKGMNVTPEELNKRYNWLKDKWKNNRKEMVEIATRNLKFANIANEKMRKEEPERYYGYRIEGGKMLYQWCLDNYGGEKGFSEYCSNLAKETHKKHPELAHHLGMITQERHPNIIECAHKWQRENPEKVRQIMKETLPKIMKSNLKNKPYWFMGIPFDSNDEIKVVKYLNEKINYIPEYGVNYQYQVDTKFVDFYLPEYNLFIEYHPIDWRGLSDEEYRQERLEAINKTDHDEQLWVIKKVDDLDNMLW